MALNVPGTLDSQMRKKKKKARVTTTGAIADPEAGVTAVGAIANPTPPEKKETGVATSGATARVPPEKMETGVATSRATARTPPEKKEARLTKKRARAKETQSQEREKGPSTEPTNAPLKSKNSTRGRAKQGSQLQRSPAPRRFKMGTIQEYPRRLAQKESHAKMETGIQEVKAPKEPGATPNEQHKVEGRGEGRERELNNMGVEASGLLSTLAHELGKKEVVLRREEKTFVTQQNEEKRGARSRRWEMERQSRQRASLKKKRGALQGRSRARRVGGRRGNQWRRGGRGD
jgi:hypothetical protein